MTDGLGNAGLIAIVAIVPLVVLMLTSFVKISVVLALLRNAIGAPDAPSGLIVMGVSLILTFFVMAPVGIDMVRAAGADASPATGPGLGTGPATPTPTPAPAPGPTPAPTPGPTPTPTPASTPAPPHTGAADAARSGAAPGTVEIDAAIRRLVPEQYREQVDAVERGMEPLRGFLAKHAASKDRDTFVGVAQRMGRAVKGDELWVLAPAFVASELREAFAIAVLIFVPFLVIDLVVGLGLAALGLVTTSPQTVALPLKLLLFVAVDGWRLLLDSLLRGYV